MFCHQIHVESWQTECEATSNICSVHQVFCKLQIVLATKWLEQNQKTLRLLFCLIKHFFWWMSKVCERFFFILVYSRRPFLLTPLQPCVAAVRIVHMPSATGCSCVIYLNNRSYFETALNLFSFIHKIHLLDEHVMHLKRYQMTNLWLEQLGVITKYTNTSSLVNILLHHKC